MSEFSKEAVHTLLGEIETTFAEFMADAKKVGVKAAARRARKNSIEFSDLLKKFRKISIK